MPITPLGRFIAGVTSLMGIMVGQHALWAWWMCSCALRSRFVLLNRQVLAIPITVISTNFSQEFNKLKKQKEALRARNVLLRSLTQAKRCVSQQRRALQARAPWEGRVGKIVSSAWLAWVFCCVGTGLAWRPSMTRSKRSSGETVRSFESSLTSCSLVQRRS